MEHMNQYERQNHQNKKGGENIQENKSFRDLMKKNMGDMTEAYKNSQENIKDEKNDEVVLNTSQMLVQIINVQQNSTQSLMCTN